MTGTMFWQSKKYLEQRTSNVSENLSYWPCHFHSFWQQWMWGTRISHTVRGVCDSEIKKGSLPEIILMWLAKFLSILWKLTDEWSWQVHFNQTVCRARRSKIDIYIPTPLPSINWPTISPSILSSLNRIE